MSVHLTPFVDAIKPLCQDQEALPCLIPQNPLLSKTAEDFAQEALPLLHSQNQTGSTTRYHFPPTSARHACLTLLFKEAFQKDANSVITAAQKIDPAKRSFYPLWKEVFWIKLPQSVAAAIDFPPLRLFVLSVCLYLSYRQIWKISSVVQAYMMWHGTPWWAHYHSKALIINWPMAAILSVCVLSDMVHFKIFNGGSAMLRSAWKISDDIAQFLRQISKNGEERRLGLGKQYAFRVWDVEITKILSQ